MAGFLRVSEVHHALQLWIRPDHRAIGTGQFPGEPLGVEVIAHLLALRIRQSCVVNQKFRKITLGSREEIRATAGVAQTEVNHPRPGVQCRSLGAFEFPIDVAAEDIAIVIGFKNVPAEIQFSESVVRTPTAGR